ncbi:hypothetical protein BC829DRAFT_58539 [Chytridium lagenaria]|nr:hypothetical protein BC829DRAFT_58539 [Chytridium lagenaria]
MSTSPTTAHAAGPAASLSPPPFQRLSISSLIDETPSASHSTLSSAAAQNQQQQQQQQQHILPAPPAQMQRHYAPYHDRPPYYPHRHSSPAPYNPYYNHHHQHHHHHHPYQSQTPPHPQQDNAMSGVNRPRAISDSVVSRPSTGEYESKTESPSDYRPLTPATSSSSTPSYAPPPPHYPGQQQQQQQPFPAYQSVMANPPPPSQPYVTGPPSNNTKALRQLQNRQSPRQGSLFLLLPLAPLPPPRRVRGTPVLNPDVENLLPQADTWLDIQDPRGLKPYACPIKGCPSRFSRQDNMMQHSVRISGSSPLPRPPTFR